ncbi:DUF4232 domain-containing protein [Streptomyces sp. SP18CS02]|uniref:DUF4232 domain-containing protein n=1 Tax=Streptomyces sp. SP18CS02 TaxID=3002531 RepID=UPI002E784832|nr:DUF4232 domain-containing protein [Streptomyces sp. SP18CS02]MEE1753516.1 DUF4232 domain-containing protein [Streptomyces sp. SP18CS02]
MRTRSNGRVARNGLALTALLALAASAVACDGGETVSSAPRAPGVPSASAVPAAPSAPATASGPPGETDPRACPASGVRVSTGPVDAAMGVRGMAVNLLNCGTRPYEVSGYPDLEVLDERGEKLDIAVRLGTDSVGGTAARSTFVLGPGKQAFASLIWRNTVTRTDVVATSGAYLRVTPAGGAEAQTVAPRSPLDLGNTDTVEVTAWKASAS